MNKLLIILLVATLFSGCSAKVPDSDEQAKADASNMRKPYGSDFDQLVEAGDSDIRKTQGKDYEAAFITRGQSQPPQGVNITNCPEGSESFTMVFVVNEQGRIIESYSSPESDESRCITKEFAVHEYPIPPFSPFHIVMEWAH